MSRIGKAPVNIPSGVEIKIQGKEVTAKGPKGELSFGLSNDIEVAQNDGSLTVSIAAAAEKGREAKKVVALSGTTRAMLNNIIKGVSDGFERRLTIIGVGYRGQVQGTTLKLSLGHSHPVEYTLPEGVAAEMPSNTEIVLKGADKQLLGQVAANIRSFRPPEPYKGKGVRYSDEYVPKKQAKKK